MDVNLRDARVDDAPMIAEWAAKIDSGRYMSRIYPRYYLEHSAIDRSYIAWFIISVDAHDAGTLWLEKESPENTKARLGILIGEPNLLGRGAGQRAIMLAIERSRNSLGFDTVDLRVRKDNPRAIACYERCGFHIVEGGVKSVPDGDPSEFYAMRLILT